MTLPRSLFRPRTIGGERFRLVDWKHPRIEAMVLEEMGRGFDVYYDREWPLTVRFCEFLLERPDLLAGRGILVAGAGVGPEAVVAGRLGRELWINDRSPVALELLAQQLQENGIRGARTLAGSFAEIPLPSGLDLVIASFAIYDRETAAAMDRLLRRTGERGVPVLLANQEIGGHLQDVIDRCERPVQAVLAEDAIRVIQIGGAPEAATPP